MASATSSRARSTIRSMAPSTATESRKSPRIPPSTGWRPAVRDAAPRSTPAQSSSNRSPRRSSACPATRSRSTSASSWKSSGTSTDLRLPERRASLAKIAIWARRRAKLKGTRPARRRRWAIWWSIRIASVRTTPSTVPDTRLRIPASFHTTRTRRNGAWKTGSSSTIERNGAARISKPRSGPANAR